MRRFAFPLVLCALACCFPAGLALAGGLSSATALPGDTNTSSDTLPDEGPGPANAGSGVAQAPQGAPVVGRRLTLPTALVGSVQVQWQSCRGRRCAAIPGATKPTLLLTRTLVGKTVRVVAVTDAGVRIVSAASAPVRAKR